MIPISKPQIGLRERRAVSRVLRSGQLTQGPEVEAFEKEFSSALGRNRPTVALNSGTSGLHLALLAAGVGPGDEVIVPSFTFAATANSVVLAGAAPVFCDIDLDTYTMDSRLIDALVTERTKAIMPVHLFGHPAPMDKIMGIAKVRGLRVIEDAAQAHGASIDGQTVGTFGDFGVFSLYPSKNMTSGEGGMVTCETAESAQWIRLLRNQGMETPYQNEIVGFNNRMSDIHAAIGRAQLQKLSRWTRQRRRNAQFLSAAITGLEVPVERRQMEHVFHQYVVRVPEDRTRFVEALRAQFKITCGIYYPTPSHRLASLEPYGRGVSLPVTEKAASEVVALPVHPSLTTRQLHHIARAVNSLSRAGA